MSSSLCLFPFNLNVTLILCVSFISDIAIYIYCQCYVCPPLDPTPHSNPFTPEKKKKKDRNCVERPGGDHVCGCSDSLKKGLTKPRQPFI
jgi:hypothetical protein